MDTVRRTGGRAELDAIWKRLVSDLIRRHYSVVASPDPDAVAADFVKVQSDLVSGQTDIAALGAKITAALRRAETRALGHAGIANATLAGRLKTASAVAFSIDGKVFTEGATDPEWDLSAEVDTIAAQYRAYWLYLDAAGTPTIAAGTNAASEAAAIAALPAETANKCPIGVYIAGPVTDFDNVGGLAAQGTIVHGRAAALAALGALETASLDTAALSTTGIDAVTISNGGTAGRLELDTGAAYAIGENFYSKAATDNLWNLSALTDTTASQYLAVWLFLNAAGTASIGAGTPQASAAAALRSLPALDGTKSIIGVFVADPETNWDDAGGLEAQGTIYVGVPDGAAIGVPGDSYGLDLVRLGNA